MYRRRCTTVEKSFGGSAGAGPNRDFSFVPSPPRRRSSSPACPGGWEESNSDKNDPVEFEEAPAVRLLAVY
jgi:hypothetical protein